MEGISLYIYVGLIMLMAAYLGYTNVKLIQKARALYKEVDIKKFELIDTSKKWMFYYALMFIAVVLMLLFGNQSGDVVLLSISLMLIVLSELGGTYLRFKFYYNDKSFIYEAKIYRLKSVRTVNRLGKFFKKTEVVMFDGTKVQLPRMFGNKVDVLINKTKK